MIEGAKGADTPGTRKPFFENVAAPNENAVPPNQALLDLTPRQKEILDGMVHGLPNKVMAYDLGIATVTVKLHVGQVMRRLGASNRTEAVSIALQNGYASDKSNQ